MTKDKLKILIVDDDKFLLDIYAVKFKEEGFNVDTAMGGEEALVKLSDKSAGFNVVVMDMVMPGMDGETLLGEIKKKGLEKGLVRIVLSNQGQPEEIKRAEAFNIDGYIVKASAIPSEVLDEVKSIAQSKLE